MSGGVTFSKGKDGKSIANSNFVSHSGPQRQSIGVLSSTKQRVFLGSSNSDEVLEKKVRGPGEGRGQSEKKKKALVDTHI